MYASYIALNGFISFGYIFYLFFSVVMEIKSK